MKKSRVRKQVLVKKLITKNFTFISKEEKLDTLQYSLTQLKLKTAL
jgi:hypothetical protein